MKRNHEASADPILNTYFSVHYWILLPHCWYVNIQLEWIPEPVAKGESIQFLKKYSRNSRLFFFHFFSNNDTAQSKNSCECKFSINLMSCLIIGLSSILMNYIIFFSIFLQKCTENIPWIWEPKTDWTARWMTLLPSDMLKSTFQS